MTNDGNDVETLESGGGGGSVTDDRLESSRYDPDSSVALVSRIVETVAAADGADPTEFVDPINEVIDVDALERLFEDFGTAAAPSGHVVFEYEGYRVEVRSDGFIRVY